MQPIIRCLEAEVLTVLTFPSISTGVYGYPVEMAANVAVSTVVNYMVEFRNEIDEIVWVLFDEKAKSAYDKELSRFRLNS